jgi:hypothetical protein
MNQMLISLGCLLLAVVVGAHVLRLFLPDAESINLICKGTYTQGLLMGAGVCFGIVLLLRVLSPVKKIAPRTRCKKCNAPIPKGDTYCGACLKDLRYKSQYRT